MRDPRDTARETILLPLRIAKLLAERGRLGDRELMAVSQATVEGMKAEGLDPIPTPVN